MRKLHYTIRTTVMLAVCTTLLAPLFALAQSCPGGFVCVPNPLKAENFLELIKSITNLIIFIGVAISPLFLAWGGLQYIFGAGDPTQTGQAFKTIKYTLVGLILLILGGAIINLFIEIIKTL